VTFLIFALLSGFFLGIYCQVLVLIPATLAVAATYGVVALLDSGSAFSSASFIIVPSVSLQGGYMMGLTSRDFLVPFLTRGDGRQTRRT
jgi:hypothetical protein